MPSLDKVLSNGDECILWKILGNYNDYDKEGPPCELLFRQGGVEATKKYDCMFGRRAGSVRLYIYSVCVQLWRVGGFSYNLYGPREFVKI